MRPDLATKKYLEDFYRADFWLEPANLLIGGAIRKNPHFLLSSVIKIISEDTYEKLERRRDNRGFLRSRYADEAAAVAVGDPGSAGGVHLALVSRTSPKLLIFELSRTSWKN